MKNRGLRRVKEICKYFKSVEHVSGGMAGFEGPCWFHSVSCGTREGISEGLLSPPEAVPISVHEHGLNFPNSLFSCLP